MTAAAEAAATLRATLRRFEAFLAELRATAEADPDIVGRVGMGSTAERDRVDQWSDHDFALLTVPGAEDRFRDSLAWLPGADRIALSVREHHGGMKVIYDDGRVLEFGITDLAGLAGWHANAYEVLYDANGVADAMARVVARPLPTGGADDARDMSLVLPSCSSGWDAPAAAKCSARGIASARRPWRTCFRCWGGAWRPPGPNGWTTSTRDAASRWPTRLSGPGSTTCSPCARRTARMLYWGWDFAGFSGEVPDGELYLRAAAASVFVPITQYHSEFNHHRTPSHDRTPWNIAERNFDDRVIPIFKRLIEVRERLVPYLAEPARHTVATSAPLMRPLYFAHPADENVWRHPLQWLLGDDLLVAPVVTAGAKVWPVYLPVSDWVDVWTGRAFTGGQVVTRPVPLHEIPVYCRATSWAALGPVFGRGDETR